MRWFNISIMAAAGVSSLLAQIPSPTGSELLTAIGAVLVIVTVVRVYFEVMANRRTARESNEPARRILPDPLSIRNVDDYVTQPDFEKLEAEMDRKFDHIYQVIREEGRRVDSRVNDVLTEVSKLSGAFHQSQRRHHPHDG